MLEEQPSFLMGQVIYGSKQEALKDKYKPIECNVICLQAREFPVQTEAARS